MIDDGTESVEKNERWVTEDKWCYYYEYIKIKISSYRLIIENIIQLTSSSMYSFAALRNFGWKYEYIMGLHKW